MGMNWIRIEVSVILPARPTAEQQKWKNSEKQKKVDRHFYVSSLQNNASEKTISCSRLSAKLSKEIRKNLESLKAE